MIFVSYAHEDRARVEALVRALEKCGLDITWDRELWGDEGYRELIDKAIDEAIQVIVVWTKASRKSGWVQEEADRARELGKLLQVRLDPVRPPLGFGSRTYEDLLAWGKDSSSDDSELEGLLDALVVKAELADIIPTSEAVARRLLELFRLVEILVTKVPEFGTTVRGLGGLKHRIERVLRSARRKKVKVVAAAAGFACLLVAGTVLGRDVIERVWPPSEPDATGGGGPGGAGALVTGGSSGGSAIGGRGGTENPPDETTAGVSGATGVGGTGGARATDGAGGTAGSAGGKTPKPPPIPCCDRLTGMKKPCNESTCAKCGLKACTKEQQAAKP